MAATVIEFECVPGTTTAYMVSAGGTGTEAGSYPISAVAGGTYYNQITVNEALVGRWVVAAGDPDGRKGYRLVSDLTDEAKTFAIPDFAESVENIPKYDDPQTHTNVGSGVNFDDVIISRT